MFLKNQIRHLLSICLVALSTYLYATPLTNDISYAIVFVHLGKEIPLYTQTAISQAHIFNPKAPIYLIAEEDAYKTFVRSRKLLENSYENITFISCESLTPSKKHLFFNQKSSLDRTFRNGFWQYATERFFYLEEFIYKYQLTNVFHLENDVMLYADLEKLLPNFCNNYQGLGAVFDNEVRVVPSFIYIKDLQALKIFTHFLITKVHSKENDMETLAGFKSIKLGKYIDHLPIVHPIYVEKHPMISSLGHTTKKKENYSKHFAQFLSIFDGAAIGQYLGGIDPRNAISTIGFINESCLFNPSHFQYTWEEDEEGRLIPLAIFEGEKIKINNLHIHSKNLDIFYSYRNRG